MDALAQFKENQKKAWSTFAPTEVYTCQPAARLVTFAQIKAGQRVLDVGCGTGVVALAAARTGAHVTGLDLTPELIVRARENAALAGAEINWHEGDAEALPFGDASFDVVVSQFGHMFAPRPDVATREMLRVLKPGGTIAFTTWPPELWTGRMFALVGRYLPPPPGVSPPPQWGVVEIVRERLGAAVTDLVTDRGTLRAPYLSVQHVRAFMEVNVGPVMRILQTFANEPARIAEFRRELDLLTAQYFETTENVLRQDYLLT
ncbi:MAG TPA: class I SAM-dependent methyltransferase, partial [Kofleriaceae bacterium]|nr:class I SAM-dependent methyltransferase [Kofleriaceae bacterium]